MKAMFIFCLLLFSAGLRAERSVHKDQMLFRLEKLSIRGHTLSFKLLLVNHSRLGYTPAYVKFIVRDRHIAKRTAVQERELVPVNFPVISEVIAGGSCDMVFSFYQVTLPRTKELVIEMTEKNGSRLLSLHIAGRRLLRMIREE